MNGRMQFFPCFNRKRGLRSIVFSVFLGYCCLTAWAQAHIVILLPDGPANFGSGASIDESLYYPGGTPGVGLFIGDPNDNPRHDRALFRYNVSRFLLAPEKVTKAEFSFSIVAITGLPQSRKVRVEHFLCQLEALTGAALTDPQVEKAGDVPISEADNESHHPAPKRLDVTKLIQNDLYQGSLITTFRLLDELVETSGPNGKVSGVTFDCSKEAIPKLKIWTDSDE